VPSVTGTKKGEKTYIIQTKRRKRGGEGGKKEAIGSYLGGGVGERRRRGKKKERGRGKRGGGSLSLLELDGTQGGGDAAPTCNPS